MTSGRDANWADMGAVSEITLDARGGPPRNMGKARRQCRADPPGGAENSAAGAAIAGEPDPSEVKKPMFYGLSGDGTRFADRSARIVWAALRGTVGVWPCCL